MVRKCVCRLIWYVLVSVHIVVSVIDLLFPFLDVMFTSEKTRHLRQNFKKGIDVIQYDVIPTSCNFKERRYKLYARARRHDTAMFEFRTIRTKATWIDTWRHLSYMRLLVCAEVGSLKQMLIFSFHPYCVWLGQSKYKKKSYKKH